MEDDLEDLPEGIRDIAKKVGALPEGAPPISKLMLESSLYEPLTFTPAWATYILRLRTGGFQFDAHCLACKTGTIFKADSRPLNLTAEGAMQDAEFVRVIACSRNKKHTYTFYFRIADSTLQKIGQFPSLQDVAGAELRQYRSVLADEDFAELNKATGLFSHGIGVGSFVYLRRIFERIINTHRADHEKQHGEIAKWSSMRMDEKIQALADVLPPFLVENRVTYGILSRGIHELDEEQCKRFFPVVRGAIILILQQDLESKKRKIAEETLRKGIAAISSEAGKS